jgi:hypothetical protein
MFCCRSSYSPNNDDRSSLWGYLEFPFDLFFLFVVHFIALHLALDDRIWPHESNELQLMHQSPRMGKHVLDLVSTCPGTCSHMCRGSIYLHVPYVYCVVYRLLIVLFIGTVWTQRFVLSLLNARSPNVERLCSVVESSCSPNNGGSSSLWGYLEFPIGLFFLFVVRFIALNLALDDPVLQLMHQSPQMLW